MADLLKQSDPEFSAQLRVFSSKLPNYAVALGLTTDELNAVAADADALLAVVQEVHRIRAHAQSWTAFKDQLRTGEGDSPASFPAVPEMPAPPVAVPPGIDHRFRRLVRRIKAHPAYSTGMGKDLGIHIDTVSAAPAAPGLRLRFEGGKPHVRFTKKGMHGIYLYGRRGAEEKFTLLATVTRSPYIDQRPNLEADVPEKREYHAFYMMNDRVAGVKSPVAQLVV
jgi:hypothetical protein